MIEQPDFITKVTEISHEKLLPMPEKSALMFHHTFYPKPQMKDAKISQKHNNNYKL